MFREFSKRRNERWTVKVSAFGESAVDVVNKRKNICAYPRLITARPR